MFKATTLRLFKKRLLNSRKFHLTFSLAKDERGENPILRTLRILGDDLSFKKPPIDEEDYRRRLDREFPRFVDIVVIGGGAMGSSVAYWLKERTGIDGITVAVIEEDPTYTKCSTTLSVGGLRQQFSLKENIEMSIYGAEFMRTIKKRFGPDAEVNFHPNGYLMLASSEGAQTLLDNSRLQKELGAVNTILTRDQIKNRFPWMTVDDVEVGCLGLEKEGWFDPWSLLTLLRNGAIKKGAQFINAKAIDFLFEDREDIIVEGAEQGTYQSINKLVVEMPNGEHRTIDFAYCVIAAGCMSQEIAEKAKIGVGTGMLSIPLPVEKRKRYVYTFNCQKGAPSLDAPMLIDYTHMYFRREGLGGCFIAGMSPDPEDEPPTDNLEVDYSYFDEKVWPLLARRVPAFECIKVSGAWSGFYEYNTYDMNGIIGPHPYYTNMYIATGFSGHGIQQAPAVGRAISELILDGNFQTIDLTRLGFDRLIVDKPMFELRIV